jgi:hypothetical protein
MILTPGVNVMLLFVFRIDEEAKEAEHLHLASLAVLSNICGLIQELTSEGSI